jgi:hypothetical protein
MYGRADGMPSFQLTVAVREIVIVSCPDEQHHSWRRQVVERSYDALACESGVIDDDNMIGAYNGGGSSRIYLLVYIVSGQARWHRLENASKLAAMSGTSGV